MEMDCPTSENRLESGSGRGGSRLSDREGVGLDDNVESLIQEGELRMRIVEVPSRGGKDPPQMEGLPPAPFTLGNSSSVVEASNESDRTNVNGGQIFMPAEPLLKPVIVKDTQGILNAPLVAPATMPEPNVHPHFNVPWKKLEAAAANPADTKKIINCTMSFSAVADRNRGYMPVVQLGTAETLNPPRTETAVGCLQRLPVAGKASALSQNSHINSTVTSGKSLSLSLQPEETLKSSQGKQPQPLYVVGREKKPSKDASRKVSKRGDTGQKVTSDAAGCRDKTTPKAVETPRRRNVSKKNGKKTSWQVASTIAAALAANHVASACPSKRLREVLSSGATLPSSIDPVRWHFFHEFLYNVPTKLATIKLDCGARSLIREL